MLTAKQFTGAVARRLKAARQIDVRYSEGLKPTPAAERDELAARLTDYLGEKPSAELRRRLSFPRHLKLYWEYPAADEADIFNGEISLNNLGVALLEKDLSHMNYAENPELLFLDTYRILDDHPYMGDGNMTIVALEESMELPLHYLERGKPYPLRLTFEEYAWCLTVTLGYAHWQFLFCEGLADSMRDYLQNTYRPKLVRDINTIWPGTDLGEFFALADRAG